jgi:signal recognition particle receptor subunit beta
MAWFDPERECYVVRIVYDGPGLAGKTTNLQHVCELVPISKRTELFTPGALKGRTMFFDWLEMDGAADAPVKFQLITVPGQEQRNYRRRPLIEMADVVVFVCDSTPEQIPDTMRTFARLRVSMRQRPSPLPLVVQANKQDLEHAVAPDKIRRRLRIGSDVPVLPASAATGEGVAETLTLALKLSVAALEGVDLEPFVKELAAAEALFDHVLTFEDNPTNDEPIDVEELNVAAEDLDVSAELVAAHLNASPLDALEARARRGAERGRPRTGHASKG